MKLRGLYLLLFVAGLFFVSCQKQSFSPISDGAEVPVWQDDSENMRVIEGGEITTDEEDEEDPNGEITDPNSDPDGDKPAKSKKN